MVQTIIYIKKLIQPNYECEHQGRTETVFSVGKVIVPLTTQVIGKLGAGGCGVVCEEPEWGVCVMLWTVVISN